MSVATAIQVTGLTKRFGDFVAVDDVSLAVAQGEVFGFLGPNGAGKTTTIRILLGLLPPTQGTVKVLDYDVPRQSRAMHAVTGYMSQQFTLYRDLTASENIDFYAMAYGLSRAELGKRRDEILTMAGLKGREGELTARLSGGWRQRLALGCAIIHRPQLVFLDEPTAGVDPVSRQEFWELIYTLAHQGMTVFVTTHYMDEAEHCHRVAFIDHGAIVALGSPSYLKAHQMRGQVTEIVCNDAEAAVRTLQAARDQGRLNIREVALYGSRLHLISDTAVPAELVASELLKQGLVISSIHPVTPSLEDVFISSMQSSQPPRDRRG